MKTAEQSDRGPVIYLVGTIVVAILVMVALATLLRKPAETNPFDASPAATEPAAPSQ